MTPQLTETWTVGDIRVSRVVEMELPSPGELLLPEATAALVLAHRAELGPHVTDDGWLMVSIHGFVLDTGARRILVDGGVGNGKTRPSPFFDQLDTGFLDALAGAGYPPDTIDTVVATHLHPDHVGWFTQRVDGQWQPVFPHARHVIPAAEHAHWREHPDIARDGDYMADLVAPVVEAGLVDLVEPHHEIAPGIRLLPTPGHSPTHVSVLIESGSGRAVITGDVLHHPVQLLHPELTCVFDHDPAQATATRRAFLERWADGDTLVLGTHFATPAALHVKRGGDAWSYTP
jgi:glyoxylase-like metal-dependent hydrolase (beta-lactamase superfamily II)